MTCSFQYHLQLSIRIFTGLIIFSIVSIYLVFYATTVHFVKTVPGSQNEDVPVVYVITPTYWRANQRPDLLRMAQSLALAKGIHWIIVEDAKNTSLMVESLASRFYISHTILAIPTPQGGTKTRGGVQRNLGLHWLLEENITSGVIYFADDDNSYDVRLFDEIRDTQTVSVFPVGSMGRTGISSPVVKDGKIIGFRDPALGRKFPLDMAGFAISVQYWRKHPAQFKPENHGLLETGFLEAVNISLSDFNIKADNCTKVYVWHTQTKAPREIQVEWNKAEYEQSNIAHLEKLVNRSPAR